MDKDTYARRFFCYCANRGLMILGRHTGTTPNDLAALRRVLQSVADGRI
jgi:hypothetical protein